MNSMVVPTIIPLNPKKYPNHKNKLRRILSGAIISLFARTKWPKKVTPIVIRTTGWIILADTAVSPIIIVATKETSIIVLVGTLKVMSINKVNNTI